MFNPTPTSCHITYKAGKRSSSFNPFIFVGSNSQSTVALSEDDTLEKPSIELAGPLLSTSESGADGTDPQSEL